jgi:hypothetical protein
MYPLIPSYVSPGVRVRHRLRNAALEQRWATGGQRAFFIWPMLYFQIHHTILKFSVHTLAYRYNNCYLVLNIVKCLNVIICIIIIIIIIIRIAFKHSCLYSYHRPYTNRRSMGIVLAVRRECAVLILVNYYAHAQ